MMLRGVSRRLRSTDPPVVAASSICGSARPISAVGLKDLIMVAPVFPWGTFVRSGCRRCRAPSHELRGSRGAPYALIIRRIAVRHCTHGESSRSLLERCWPTERASQKISNQLCDLVWHLVERKVASIEDVDLRPRQIILI